MQHITPDNSKSVEASERNASVVGDLRFHELRSRTLGNRRLLRVWLPPRYDAIDNASRRYPVFYLNDGQNLFDTATSFTGVEWQVDQAADRLIRQEIIPPMIFVGIDNSGEARIREYLPYASVDPPVLRPRGRKYGSFLTDEVMPFIAERYRVRTSPEHTGLGGSSMGALISLYVALTKPGIFGRLLLESPSLWVARSKILRESGGFGRWPWRIFLGVGTRETGRAEQDLLTVERVKELAFLMRQGGLDDHRLHVEVDDGASHSEEAWARRFPTALTFLFGHAPSSDLQSSKA